MTKRRIKAETVKMLLLRSGNQCAFPECIHPIFNDNNLLIAQLCHIESVSPGGQRYNPLNSIETNNSSDNLMFMCYQHHKETDDTTMYTVEKLKEIKRIHESQFKEQRMHIIPNMIKQIEDEMTYYWRRINQLRDEDSSGLMIEIDTTSGFEDIVNDVNSHLDYLFEALERIANSNDSLYDDVLVLFEKLNYQKERFEQIPYYENPLINRNWELLNLGTLNAVNVMRLRLKQLGLKYFEQVVINDVQNIDAKYKLESLKRDLEKIVQEIGYRD